MILLLGKRIYRFVLFLLILLLVVPVIQYYGVRALNPQYVQFREPRGEALKVSAEQDGRETSTVVRFLYYLHDFYQNGL